MGGDTAKADVRSLRFSASLMLSIIVWLTIHKRHCCLEIFPINSNRQQASLLAVCWEELYSRIDLVIKSKRPIKIVQNDIVFLYGLMIVVRVI